MVSLEKYYRFTAQQEYEKNPKLSSADVQELLNWSNENIKLHGKFINLQIIMFLHASGYDKELAKKLIYQNHTLKAKKCFNFFSQRNPFHPSIQKILDICYINFTHDKDTDYGYIWIMLNTADASHYCPTVLAKTVFMAIDIDQINCGTKSAYKIVLDSNNFGLSHALKWSINDARNLTTYIQDGTNFIIDKVYLINSNFGTEMIYSITKQFMRASLINKITMKSNSQTDELIKTLPQAIVPKDYGGLATNMSDSHNILKDDLIKNSEYFLKEEQLRNGNVKHEVDIDEVNKDKILSFKDLSID